MCGVSRLLTALVLVVAIGVADMVDGGASVAVVVSGAVQMDYQERLRGLLPVTCNRRVSFALVLGSASEHVCVCVCVCVLHALPAVLLAHEPVPVDDCSGR